MSDFSTPAGWYPDGDGWERRWNGSGWTEERRRMAEPTQMRPASPPPPAGPPTGPPTAPPPTQAPPAGYPPAPGHQPGQQPGYGHVPQPAFGGGYPQAGPPRKSRLWLWLTLAVVGVLGIGAAITLVVLQPWSGDDTTADPVKDPKGKEPAAAIQGDLNGDDLGDALYYVYQDYDAVTKVTATSTGNGFELTEVAADPATEPRELSFDWDGDGVNERLTWRFVSSGKQITLSSGDADFPGDQTYTLALSTLKEYGDIEIRLAPGDFDGDGDLDLAIAGPNDKVVDVSVLANDGAGTFAEPVLWLSVPNAVIDEVEITPGDFDKDGDADLWTQVPASRLTNKDYTSYYSGDRGYALLTSTGSAFTAGAVTKATDYSDALLVGDVTGDGTASIVGVNTDSYREQLTVTVYDVSSGQLKAVTGFTGTSKIGQRSLQGASLSDVDGDGKADVVFVVKGYEETKFAGVQVMRSTGAVFDPALVWAETPACVDDGCRIEFVGDRRY